MKRFLLILTAFLLFANFASAQNLQTDVERFRAIREKQFKDRSFSPLLAEDFSKFEHLNYFAESEKYRVKATLILMPDEKVFMMPTSTGTAHKYRKVGTLKFELDGASYSLGAYSREYGANDARAKMPKRDLFVPFKDLSNGAETYGGGRYIYLKTSDAANQVTIDFNLAYNPSCAYGDPSFSCPIPPRENFLQTTINAGEKIYKITAQSK